MFAVVAKAGRATFPPACSSLVSGFHQLTLRGPDWHLPLENSQ